MITLRVVSRAAFDMLIHARADIAPNTRCDRCIAAAQTRVTFYTGSVLYLCGHHWRAHEYALESDVNATIYTQANPCTCNTCRQRQETD